MALSNTLTCPFTVSYTHLNVGLEPWSVLQEGMSNTMGITYGTASILVGAVIIAVSLLCGEPIGLGTVLNIVLCAVFIDGIQAMGWIPQMLSLIHIWCCGHRPRRPASGWPTAGWS